MTTNSNSNSKVTLASLFPLVRLLKTRVAVYAPESDHDLGQLLLSVDPKALGGKMKLLALVCKELGREKPLKLLETRKAEKRLEVRANASEGEKEKRSGAFLQVYAIWIWKELETLGLLSEGRPKDPLKLFQRNDYYLKAVAGLVSKITTEGSEQKKVSTAPVTSKKRHDEKIPPATLKKADTATTLNEDVEPLEDSHLLPLNSFPSSHHRSVGNSKMNPSSNGAKSVQMALEKAQQNEQIKHLEEELASLKGKYERLSRDHDALKSLYETAMGPAQLSNALDKRRAFILKSQNVQQQRHLTVLKEALDSKEGFVYEVQEDLYKIQDVLRQSIKTLENTKKEKETESVVPQQLKSCIQYIDVVQKQMNRRVKDHLRDSSMEYKTSDFLFVSEFAAQPKEGSLQSVSLMDICSGDLAHLNLKHVSRLESQLHKLHEHLAKLQCSLDTCLVPNLLPELQEHAKSTLDDAQTELLSSLNSLLSLLVLIPSAPCPHLDKVRVTGLPTLPSSDEILAQLPNLSSSVKSAFKKVWDQLLKGLRAFIDMKSIETEAHGKELEFHKNIYKKFNTEMLHVVKGLESKRNEVKGQLEGVEFPLLQIKEQMSRLELHPVAVNAFLKDTDSRIESVLGELKSLSFQREVK